jgi:hypothetical protein
MMDEIAMSKQLKRLVGKVVPDRYACNARLYPSLLVIAPAVIAVVAIAKLELSWLHSLWIGIGAAGGLYWLSQLARDPGKALEPDLWQAWGGAPSIAILRHCDSRIDPITKARYHARLVELVLNTMAPTPEFESTNPGASDACYSAWSTYLRTATRDQKRFRLVFDELVSYGYRRNLLGLRPYGLTSNILSCLGCGTFICLAMYQKREVSDALWLASSADILLLVFWFFRVSPVWVRVNADHYAARLVEAVDDLHVSHHRSPPATAPAKPRKPRTVKSK